LVAVRHRHLGTQMPSGGRPPHHPVPRFWSNLAKVSCGGITGRSVSSIGEAALTGTHKEHTWAGIFAKASAVGGLPVPIAAIAFPSPAGRCFPDPESRYLNRLRLISFRLARSRAYAPPRALALRANASVAAPQRAVRGSVDLVLLGEGLAQAGEPGAGLFRGVDDDLLAAGQQIERGLLNRLGWGDYSAVPVGVDRVLRPGNFGSCFASSGRFRRWSSAVRMEPLEGRCR
jgi:hypothetical protein